MDGDVTIESFQPDNLEHHRMFAEINRTWLIEYFEIEPTDERMFADPLGMIISQGGQILFARLGGKIVGTGALIKQGKAKYELAKMGVASAARGKGIGRKIAEALIAEARARGALKLHIGSNRKLDAALALYKSLGFRELPDGTDPRYVRCDIALELLLDATPEVGGRKGRDPTRYGDWEIGGRCVDF